MGISESSAIRVCYLTANEAAYAAGKNAVATKYLATAMEAGDAASLTGMNYPNGGAKLGIPEVNRKQIKPIGATANKVLIFNQGYRYKEFVYSQYIQSTKWLIEAIAVASGALPASHLIHLEIPAVASDGTHGTDYFDLVGCVLQKYELELDEDNFPKETLTFYYYDIKDSVAVTNCPTFIDTQPSTHKDFSVTYATKALLPSTLKLTIENELLDTKGCSKYQRLDPYMKGRTIEAEMEVYSEDSGQFLKPFAIGGALTAISLSSLVIANASPARTLTVTNMYTDTNNSGELPEERDFIKWKLSLKMGGDCSVTSA